MCIIYRHYYLIGQMKPNPPTDLSHSKSNQFSTKRIKFLVFNPHSNKINNKKNKKESKLLLIPCNPREHQELYKSHTPLSLLTSHTHTLHRRFIQNSRRFNMQSLQQKASEWSGVPTNEAFSIDETNLFQKLGLQTFINLSTNFYNRFQFSSVIQFL